MQRSYILLVLHYSVLVMFNACLWPFSFFGWSLLNLFASLHLYYAGILLVHQLLKPKGVPNESTIPTYMRYFHAVLSKFACANSNFFHFVCPYRSWSCTGWPIFSMLGGLFSWWVFIHLSLHESKAKVLGMPSPEMQKPIYFMLSNNKFLGKCWYGGHPWKRLVIRRIYNFWLFHAIILYVLDV